MEPENIIKSMLVQSIHDIYGITIDPTVEYPVNQSFGDFTTNIAMQIQKEVGKSPRVVAEEIKNELEKIIHSENESIIESVAIAGPGFINFTLKDTVFLNEFENIDSNFGQIKTENPKRIMIEAGQPNSHKLPHIGHLFSYIVGNSIARILRSTGNEILEVNYQGDIGPHVAKALWSWIKKGRPEPETLIEKVRLLQECYQEGAQAYEVDEKIKTEIDEINRKIYQKDAAVIPDWEKTRKWNLDFYLEFEKMLGIDQKLHYLESAIWEDGLAIVKKNIGRVFKESEGAIVFPGEDFGLHTRVFITSKGTPTYEAKDLGLVFKKIDDWKPSFDLAIIPTASEQNNYFDVIIEAINQIEPKLKGKVMHIGFGMVSLSTGKMSSRTGKILSAIDLIEAVRERVTEVMKEREGMSDETKADTIEKIAIGAVKFAFLRSNILQNVKFDIEESISFDGKSGPYLQYTYARIQSVLHQEPVSNLIAMSYGDLLPAERSLMVNLLKYKKIVKDAAESFAPHLISEYLYSLAQEYNAFYNNYSINSADNPQKIKLRRDLSEKTALILKSGLNLIGIETVDKM